MGATTNKETVNAALRDYSHGSSGLTRPKSSLRRAREASSKRHRRLTRIRYGRAGSLTSTRLNLRRSRYRIFPGTSVMGREAICALEGESAADGFDSSP
ncbi:hypothetical protein [Streptomyces sp. NBC_01615]|uniref:hypothetical protein n=1 Tax=Streptomyces sp. NBC_01615 TaxID=2975898 RepID=UPI003867A6F1